WQRPAGLQTRCGEHAAARRISRCWRRRPEPHRSPWRADRTGAIQILMRLFLAVALAANLGGAVHQVRKSANTAAIQTAIDAAAKTKGTVTFEPGVYLIGALFLKSGVELRIDAGVELRGVQDLAAYPVMLTRVAGVEMKWPAALINVYEQSG